MNNEFDAGAQHGTNDVVQYSIHNVSKCLLKCHTFCSCLFPLHARIAESRNVTCPNRRNYSKKLYSPCQTDRRMFGNRISFSCQSNLPFCGDDEEEIRPKPYRGLPQASHGKIAYSFKEAGLIPIAHIMAGTHLSLGRVKSK